MFAMGKKKKKKKGNKFNVTDNSRNLVSGRGNFEFLVKFITISILRFLQVLKISFGRDRLYLSHLRLLKIFLCKTVIGNSKRW